LLKFFLRLCAGISLCALLVYAPELYQAARAPYAISVPQRVLLRIALCSDHPQAADVFYSTMNIYMKKHPSVHIRVTRSNADSLFAASAFPPDLYVFPETLSPDSALFLLPSGLKEPFAVAAACDGEMLLCGVSAASAYPQQAMDLLAHFSREAAAAHPQ